jgi:hypothetical protein
MLQTEAYSTIVNYDCENFIVQSTDGAKTFAPIVLSSKHFTFTKKFTKENCFKILVIFIHSDNGIRD